MRRPISLLGLEPRPGIDPHPDSGGFRGEVRLGGDTEAVGKSRDFGVGSGEDVRVRSQGRVRGSVLEESRVGVF